MIKQNILYNIKKNNFSKEQINYLLNYNFYHNKNYILLYSLLIPRSSTESLLIMINYFKKKYLTTKILDLCTGSGIINLIKNLLNKNFKIMLNDINILSFISTHINFKHTIYICNLKHLLINKKKFNIISNNPPYICFKDWIYYHQNKYQKISLYNNFIGLNNILIFIKKTYNIILKNSTIIIEHGYNQAKIIRYLLKTYGFTNIYTKNDLTKINRITYAEK